MGKTYRRTNASHITIDVINRIGVDNMTEDEKMDWGIKFFTDNYHPTGHRAGSFKSSVKKNVTRRFRRAVKHVMDNIHNIDNMAMPVNAKTVLWEVY